MPIIDSTEFRVYDLHNNGEEMLNSPCTYAHIRECNTELAADLKGADPQEGQTVVMEDYGLKYTRLAPKDRPRTCLDLD